MRSELLVLALLAFAVTADAEAQPAPPEAGPTSAVIDLKAVIVTGDLQLRPIAKRRFTACLLPDCEVTQSVVTSFDGQATFSVVEGAWLVELDEPVELDGIRYDWSVEVHPRVDGPAFLELSNDNATTAKLPPALALPPATEVVSSEADLFARSKDGIFTVISESGTGSGFLVDPSGLVMTNHHVISGSKYLAVKTAASEKYAAVLVASDDINDVAVLRISPDVVVGRPVLVLAEDSLSAPSVQIGQKVIAIGSPLGAEGVLTTGIVSKVEEGALLSDVNINHGNSGGPLLDMSGRVVGINTFGLPTPSGPGVSGIVRIHLASRVLQSARERLASAFTPASAPLAVTTARFEPQVLRTMASHREVDRADYHLEAGPFDIQFITPPLVERLDFEDEQLLSAKQNKRARKAGMEPYEPRKDFYAWRRYTEDRYDAVVRVQAIPEIELTGGSIASLLLLGSNAHMSFKFKSDFERMELYRDGRPVEPLHPGRIPAERVASTPGASIIDRSFYGAYSYPPEAFEPGADIELRIWHSNEKKPRIRKVPPKQAERIWADFAPIFTNNSRTHGR